MSSKSTGAYYVNQSYEAYDDKPTSEKQRQITNDNRNESDRASHAQGSNCILLVLIFIVCIISLVVLLLTILMFEKIDDRCGCSTNGGQCTTLVYTHVKGGGDAQMEIYKLEHSRLSRLIWAPFKFICFPIKVSPLKVTLMQITL